MTPRNIVPFSREPDYWLMRAGKRKNNAEHVRAGLLYRQAFGQSGSPEIALRIAENYVQMGCYAAARRTALSVIRDHPSSAPAYYWLGVTALAERNEELAEQLLYQALKKGRRMPLADTVQDLLNDYAWDEPLEYARSQRARCLYQRALQQLQKNDLKAAESTLRKALRRGLCPEADALLGELLLYQKRFPESQFYLRRSLKYLPDQPAIWLVYARCSDLLGQSLEASRAFTKALSLIQTPNEWGMAAAAGLMIRCPDRVREAMQEALRREPDSNDLRYVLGALEANTGHMEAAIRLFNQILYVDPDDRDAKAALCILGFGPVPFQRIPDDAQLLRMLAEPPAPATDAALQRLAHGVTVSLGGAVSYKNVRYLTRMIWGHMSPLQRRLCDCQPFWPNAVYQTILQVFLLPEGFPATAALWPYRHGQRRIRRMRRFIKITLTKRT